MGGRFDGMLQVWGVAKSKNYQWTGCTVRLPFFLSQTSFSMFDRGFCYYKIPLDMIERQSELYCARIQAFSA